MTEPTLFDVPSMPVDAERRAILELIAGDDTHRRDRALIVEAIVYAAAHNGGRIDPNLVRARLTNPDSGELDVYPRVIGAVYNSLSANGVIQADGWTTSKDRKGGNYGKPARLYRLVRRVAA